MDIKLFTEMLRDKHFYDLNKMKYKYGENLGEFLENLSDLYYKDISLPDFYGDMLVFTENHSAVSQRAIQLLFKEQTEKYAVKSAEEEIISTCAIENIDITRESVRNILKGYAPSDEQENRIFGLKKGFEFIADRKNAITEENLYRLYMMCVGEFLGEEDRLQPGSFYRHDSVFVVSDRVEHQGLDYRKIPLYMSSLIEFINNENEMNPLVKACIIHFYIAYIHPYFDGNGRIARLVHLWFLIQRGYQSALFIPFSSEIEKSRKAYYNAFTLIGENRKFSGKTDVTPIISYFVDNVYNKIQHTGASVDTLTLYRDFLREGRVTEKEKNLWAFVLSHYGTGEFSTKMLERDFSDAAYATVRDFVLKFEAAGLLSSTKYGSRIRYRISG